MSQSTIVLITGANSGIGYAASEVITGSSDSYHVLVAGRNISACEKAVQEIKASGVKGSLTPLLLNVTDLESVQSAAKKVEKEFGRLDVLINNAGIADSTLPDSYTLKQKLDTVMTTNLTGPAIVSDTFLSLLKKSKDPRIIYVSSALGSMGLATGAAGQPIAPAEWSVYRTSKSALDMYAYQQHLKLKDEVKVFVMCPGLVKSNLRGKEEAQVNAGGNAISATTSGETLLSIVDGRRDADVGKFIHKDGLYPW